MSGLDSLVIPQPRAAAWAANTAYKAGQLVTYRGCLFTAVADFTSGAAFTFANWLPVATGNPLPLSTFDPRYTGLTFGSQSANRTNYARVLGAPMLISKLGINIGVSSGNICLAVYDSIGTGTSARPNNRLATTGAVACPAAGEASVTLDTPVVVVPGDWFALAADNATATFFKATVSGMTLALSDYAQQAGAFPCPATAAGVAAAGSMFYVAGVE